MEIRKATRFAVLPALSALALAAGVAGYPTQPLAQEQAPPTAEQEFKRGKELTLAPNGGSYVIVKKGEGQPYNSEHEAIEVKLTPAQTQGRLSITDEIWKPGAAVPTHYHDDNIEVFYIIEGQVEAVLGTESQALGTGDILYVEPPLRHAFNVKGDKDVRVLLITNPGARPWADFLQDKK